MRLSLRFIVPLFLALGILAYAVVPLVNKLTLTWFMRDLDIRASLIANTVEEPLQDLIRARNRRRITQFFTRITQDERLFAMGFCPADGGVGGGEPLATPSLPQEVTCAGLTRDSEPTSNLLQTAKGPVLVSIRPLTTGDTAGASPLGKLVLVHDMSFIARRSAETREYLFFFFVGLGLIIALITVVIAQLSWRGLMQGLRGLLRGESLFLAPGRVGASPPPPELRPLAHDLRQLIEDIEADHRSRDEDQLVWTPATLREILHRELRGQEVMVVSNREPYIHMRRGGGADIEVWRPASGLVTALEPIMRACSGTWIAHGNGDADRDVVDAHDHVVVPPPPEERQYQLRRVWLSPEEESGYYYGFANEGIWPLCHIAHVRPIFRTSDWEQYVNVNRKFARTVEQESNSPNPIVLVQDYHFALLPRMISEALPAATIISFWHIPWPNPEAFAICPWRNELLDGMLGSTILGFHTQFHVNNFVDTVDRFLEARADRETFSVSYRGKPTLVKRYPISIAWPPSTDLLSKPVEQCRTEVRQRHNLPPDYTVGIGVDRMDYTKGIEERLRAVERLFELKPEWIGKFSFIQIAAPTRARIEEYRAYELRVRELATRINQRFPEATHPPIILKAEHHQPDQIFEYYRGADVCMVTSLHDGMNLVAKEFVSARDDQRGVLILSNFTGAARELPEALVVNPYDTDECAAALDAALTMPANEQRTRMRLMRGLLQDFNVFRWAGRMLLDAASVRRRGRLSEFVGPRTSDVQIGPVSAVPVPPSTRR